MLVHNEYFFQGVIEYNSMEYYFNGERILCEYIGDFLFY